MPVVYRDDCMVVVHKPAGLLVHRTPLDPRATRFAVQIVRDQIGCRVDPVHRLDRGTSGLLVFALDKGAGAALSAQFERGLAGKRYLAVVRGTPPAFGCIDHPLTRDDGAEAQSARTLYARLAEVELPVRVDRYPVSRYSLIAVAPLTGRFHQIRRHFKHVAHPVIGDATHGKGRHNRLFASLFGCSRLLLACVGLHLRHPLSGHDLRLTLPPPDDFWEVVVRAGLAPAGGRDSVLCLSETAIERAAEAQDDGVCDRPYHGQG